MGIPAQEKSHVLSREAELALMQQVQDGDHDAFAALFTCFHQRVRHQARAMLHSEADAEDTVQEVFATLYSKRDTFRGESAVSTWLYRVTVNKALSQKRYCQRRHTCYVEDLEQDRQRWESSACLDGLEQHMLEAERVQRLRQAIADLSPVDRAVIVLGDLQGKSNQLTGEILGLSEAAVKSRRHRARLSLRDKLTSEAC